MLKRIDWKYLIVIVVGVGAIAAQFWLSHIDQTGKSVSGSILTQVPLQPMDKESILGIQVLVEGVPVVDPFLSVIQLTNDGVKPIATSDFEIPLEIRLLSKTEVVRARMTERYPDDIEAEFSWDREAVRLKPLLLNPKDKITLSVLTSGEQPQFAIKARIVGISSVPLVDATKPASSQLKNWLLLVAVFLLCVVANVLDISQVTFPKKRPSITVRRRAVVLGYILTLGVAMFQIPTILESFGYEFSFWNHILVGMGLLFISAPFASRLNRMSAPNDGPSADSHKQ